MQPDVVSATNALEGFATFLESFWTDQPFHLALGGGWNVVPLSREDMISRARSLAERLKSLREDEISADLRRKISNFSSQISWFQANTLPHLSSGNLPQVVTNFDIIMSNIESSLPSLASNWEEVSDANLLPLTLSKRIRSLEATLTRLNPKAEELGEKIQRINDANKAASDLPTDLLALKEARDEMAAYTQQAREAAQQLEISLQAMDESTAGIAVLSTEAERLVASIETAYSTATTAGLAKSFMERASELRDSTRAWVGLLFAALLVGGTLGYLRLQSIQEQITARGVDPHWIWLNAGMSLASLAAPVWFAWLATRQIGQRFRLAEDYAFKASVARAYEGYRKEAARLDPKLEARLFASALDRLDEAPLRFLSVEEHGSPYESLLANVGFQKLLDRMPAWDKETVLAAMGKAAKSDARKIADDLIEATEKPAVKA